MVSINNLQFLAAQKVRDAEALLSKRRHNAAIYLMGYALEFSFKRKISLTLGFAAGFPETRPEFTTYSRQIAAFNAISTGIPLNALKEIRNHDLNTLIKYSGAEYRIISSFLADWQTVQIWNPENRYKRSSYSASKTTDFMNSAKQILLQIA